MKIFCLLLSLSLSLFLSSINAYAKERLFRINPETVTKNGYAIAWGVRDLPVDFESVEQSDESINAFLAKYDTQFVNFIVDIEREVILSEIPSDSVSGTLGNIRLGNDYSVELFEINNAAGLEYRQSLLLATQDWKWDNSFSDAFVVEKNALQTKLINHFDLKDDIHAELDSKLSLYQKKTLENKALNYSLASDVNESLYTLKVNGEIPKCESHCEVVNIEALASFSVGPDSITMDLKKLKFQTDTD
ncbi:MAG: hypothetical protein ACXVLQ_04500 [Bacteriovorax sp.]